MLRNKIFEINLMMKIQLFTRENNCIETYCKHRVGKWLSLVFLKRMTGLKIMQSQGYRSKFGQYAN